MKTETDDDSDSIMLQVRRMKEENAAANDFNIRAIAAAAQANERLHPGRVISRVPGDSGESGGKHVMTRSVREDEL